MINFIKKYKFWFIALVVIVLGIIILFVTQTSVAKSRLLRRYTLPATSECGAGGARAMNPIFELSPSIYGYNYTLENSNHMLVKGNISFTGNIHEKTVVPIHCTLQ
jgi:hypothetical protein